LPQAADNVAGVATSAILPHVTVCRRFDCTFLVSCCTDARPEHLAATFGRHTSPATPPAKMTPIVLECCQVVQTLNAKAAVASCGCILKRHLRVIVLWPRHKGKRQALGQFLMLLARPTRCRLAFVTYTLNLSTILSPVSASGNQHIAKAGE